ncbi:MAG: lytic transglycosylase domain-containing protein [Acidimicrobiales bacterium]
MDEIRASVNQALGLVSGSQRSFQQMLESKTDTGGPRLDIENDPAADYILAGGSFGTEQFVPLPLNETSGTSVFPSAGQPAISQASPTISNLPAPLYEPGPSGSNEWFSALPPKGQKWAAEITAAANQHDLDPRLLAALVWSESAFNPSVTSSAGAIGLAQLMPGTAEGLGVDPWDPKQNLEGGARYLKTQLDRFGSTEFALAAYNSGPGRVQKSGGIPQIPETQAYVRVVMERYAQLGGGQ